MNLLIHILAFLSWICMCVGLYSIGKREGEKVGWAQGIIFVSRTRRMPFAMPRENATSKPLDTPDPRPYTH